MINRKDDHDIVHFQGYLFKTLIIYYKDVVLGLNDANFLNNKSWLINISIIRDFLQSIKICDNSRVIKITISSNQSKFQLVANSREFISLLCNPFGTILFYQRLVVWRLFTHFSNEISVFGN